LKILVISQYFWPENFRINDVCLGLKERGHEVIVVTGKPNYPMGKYFSGYSWFNNSKEIWNGITIYRSNLILRGNGGGVRLSLNYFSFAIFASLKILLLNINIDKIFIFAPSPITVGLPGIIAKKKFKTNSFLWVHDLWPESIRVAGGVRNKWILDLINNLTIFIYSNSDKILIQSKAFLPYLNKQGVNSNKIIYYPFFAESFYKIEKPEEVYLNKLPNGFKILFAGNIGEAQSFATIISAIKILKNKRLPIKLIVFGEGRMKKFVEEQIILYNLEEHIFLMGLLPAIDMPKYFCCVDGLILSLKKSEIFSITIPGKFQSYLACGKPIIASLDGVCADMILESDSGFVASPESAEKLVEAILHLYNLSEKDKNMLGNNARIYFEKEFERENLLNKLETILLNS
jgi:glycosyltransferase involved in cell wall biosynthesis